MTSRRKAGLLAMTLFCAGGTAAAMPANADSAIDYGTNAPTAADDAAIRSVLAAYTAAVSSGDERAFKTLLLNEHIPFSGIGAAVSSSAATPFDDANFRGFDQSIFKSGIRYTQTFANIHILQDGALAQVSLDFVTKEAASGRGGWGWKILQLVKVDGTWKIASEFYTGHPLPQS